MMSAQQKQLGQTRMVSLLALSCLLRFRPGWEVDNVACIIAVNPGIARTDALAIPAWHVQYQTNAKRNLRINNLKTPRKNLLGIKTAVLTGITRCHLESVLSLFASAMSGGCRDPEKEQRSKFEPRHRQVVPPVVSLT